MDWTATEIRQLRYRLGWSQAEFARSLKIELSTVSRWEAGDLTATPEERSALLRMHHQAESNSEKIQRRPVAEVMMRARGLCQIHDMDVLDLIEVDDPKTQGRA